MQAVTPDNNYPTNVEVRKPPVMSFNNQSLSVGDIVYQVVLQPQFLLVSYEVLEINDNNIIRVRNINTSATLKLNAGKVHTNPKELTQHYIDMYEKEIREIIPKKIQEIYWIQKNELGMEVENKMIITGSSEI